eukprot:scaffold563125_cov20-Prasinocladus_malaysianus.AAC.1
MFGDLLCLQSVQLLPIFAHELDVPCNLLADSSVLLVLAVNTKCRIIIAHSVYHESTHSYSGMFPACMHADEYPDFYYAIMMTADA